MATDNYVNPYVDSSVFIAWINKEVVGDVNRFEIADHVIKHAERGTYSIYISALTLAEVHKLPRGGAPPLTPEQDEMIVRFFQNEFFKVLPVDREIGESANRFCREYGIHGNDAIHLACALRAKCDVLLVWDRPLSRKVQHAGIRIEEPQMLGQRLLVLAPLKAEAVRQPAPDHSAEAPLETVPRVTVEAGETARSAAPPEAPFVSLPAAPPEPPPPTLPAEKKEPPSVEPTAPPPSIPAPEKKQE